jgi:hypothetical protein
LSEFVFFLFERLHFSKLGKQDNTVLFQDPFKIFVINFAVLLLQGFSRTLQKESMLVLVPIIL